MGCVESQPKPVKRRNAPLPYKSRQDYADRQLQEQPVKEQSPKRMRSSQLDQRLDAQEPTERVIPEPARTDALTRNASGAIERTNKTSELRYAARQQTPSDLNTAMKPTSPRDLQLNVNEATSRISQQSSDQIGKSLQPTNPSGKISASDQFESRLSSLGPSKHSDPPIPVLRQNSAGSRIRQFPAPQINTELVVTVPSLRMDINIDIY